MRTRPASKTTAIGPRQHPLIVMLMLGTLLSASNAFGQVIQFYPIRSAPLGSPPGTVGDPVTPEYNSDFGCWELLVHPGVEVDFDLQGFGWGNAQGNPTLGAISAYAALPAYNEIGGNLQPKGWPSVPRDGIYQATMICLSGGDGSPCVAPFDETCDSGANGACSPNPSWVMPPCANALFAMAVPTINYAWGVAAQVDCVVDMGTCSNSGNVCIVGVAGECPEGETCDSDVKTFGGLILEVPNDAEGTYRLFVDDYTKHEEMYAWDGFPIRGILKIPACITILSGVGRCCSNIGPNGVCEDDVMAHECAMRPEPRLFAVGETCDGECACPNEPCLSDADCNDGDACTVDTCVECGECVHTASFSVADECCNPASGKIIWIDDDDNCTIDTCAPSTGQVSHTNIPNCSSFNLDAFPKNRYVSFQTGGLPVDRAYHVWLTASEHFPESVGDLGWVAAPDSRGIARVVPDPVFLPSWPAVVRAGDCEIVPAATYEIRATADGENFEDPVVVETTASPGIKFWGDIVGDFNGMSWTPPNGVQNFSDVQAAIKTFQGAESTAPMIWADIDPEKPNRIVNFNDVLWLVLAFRGEPYPFSDPADCP